MFSFHKVLQFPMPIIMKVGWCGGENTGLRKPGIRLSLTVWPWKSHFPPNFLICNMIMILSVFLPVRDAMRLDRQLEQNAISLPKSLTSIQLSTPIAEFLYSYIWVCLFLTSIQVWFSCFVEAFLKMILPERESLLWRGMNASINGAGTPYTGNTFWNKWLDLYP